MPHRVLLSLVAVGLALAAACADEGRAQDRATAAEAVLPIGAVQGREGVSPLAGRPVAVEGVVVGNFSAGLGGVFVQDTGDGDPASSDGLFLSWPAGRTPRLRLGDRVRAQGLVAELGEGEATLTAIDPLRIEVLGRGEIAATVLAAPPAAAGDWERHEGMLLRIAAPLTVTGNESLLRRGELLVAFGERLRTPTEVVAPGAPARALAADNRARSLLLDDNRDGEYPRQLWFLPQRLSDAAPLRVGSRLAGVAGVLDQRHGRYRLQLAESLEVTSAAARPVPPRPAGDTRIVAMNLLNLFNGNGRGGGFPTERGADTAQDYRVQQRKLVATVQALAPDVLGLMEIENDGAGPDSALAQFVAALNRAGPVRDYVAIDTGQGPGGDGIRVALAYRRSRVTPVGDWASLAEGPFAGRSRPPLAQSFRLGGGPVFTVVVNHFKSKGCGEAEGAERDQGDGQSCWNALRSESARRLDAWLRSDPTGSGSDLRLVVGDLNAYAMEDPLRILREAGWRDAFALAPSATGEPPYSFVYQGQAGRLDHGLLSAELAPRLRAAAEWHSNSDEAEAFRYAHDRDGDPWAASDHDPLVLDLDLTR